MAVEFDFKMNLYPSDEKAWLELYRYAREVAKQFKVAVITLDKNPKIICGDDLIDVAGYAWDRYGSCSLLVVKNETGGENSDVSESEAS